MAEMDKYGRVKFHQTRFMEEELPGILHSTYAIENYYFTDELDLFAVVEPGKRALLPDCGDPRLCGTDHLDAVVERLGVPWENVEVYVTHFHDDHDGNVPYALQKGAKAVYLGPYVPYREDDMEAWLTAVGATRRGDDGIRGETSYLMGLIPPQTNYLDKATAVPQGHELPIAGYRFQVFSTPGHTSDHTCLLDPGHGLLFAGDHLLDSAPGLMSYYLEEHLLTRWLDNVRALRQMNLSRVFMCHAPSIVGTEAINGFLDAQIAKYDKPVAKMFDLVGSLDDTPRTPYDIAERYYARLKNGLAAEPDNVRGRRVSISFCYLEYLYDQGCILREEQDGELLYRKKQGAHVALPTKLFC